MFYRYSGLNPEMCQLYIPAKQNRSSCGFYILIFLVKHLRISRAAAVRSGSRCKELSLSCFIEELFCSQLQKCKTSAQ